MPATKTHQLQLVRTFDASPSEVYAAWTDPAALKEFWTPEPGFTVPLVEMDVRVGGRYRIEMRAPNGKTHNAIGVYKEVVPGKKLVYTWNPDQACSGDAGDLGTGETLVTMEFRSKGTGTELTFTHDLFPTEDSRNNHNRGWTGILAGLAKHLA